MAWWRPGWDGDDGKTSPTAMRELDLRACGGIWEVWVCGGALTGTLETTGNADQAWSALSALVRWTKPWGDHVAVTASVEALAALDRPAVSAGASVRLGLGVEVIPF
jgi:hypothetical protein